MALIVQKYGGSSVADTESIKRVAKRVVETEKKGNKVAVVVSAMGDTTDDLIDQALSIDSNPPEREMDMLMTAGERISMSLLAMAIHAAEFPYNESEIPQRFITLKFLSRFSLAKALANLSVFFLY